MLYFRNSCFKKIALKSKKKTTAPTVPNPWNPCLRTVIFGSINILPKFAGHLPPLTWQRVANIGHKSFGWAALGDHWKVGHELLQIGDRFSRWWQEYLTNESQFDLSSDPMIDMNWTQKGNQIHPSLVSWHLQTLSDGVEITPLAVMQQRNLLSPLMWAFICGKLLP